jgi:hypothetical protein
MNPDSTDSGSYRGSGRKRQRVGVGVCRTVVLIVAAGMVAAVTAACGGSSKSHTTSSTTTTPAHTATKPTKPKSTAAKPLQQLRVNAKGQQPGSSVKVNPGQVVSIVVRVPATDVGKKINIGVDQTNSTTFTVTSAVTGTSLNATGQISASTPGLQISGMHWACKYPRTFCPLTVLSSSTSHVKLTAKSSTVPLTVTALFDHPGAVKPPRLIPLGPPAPGSAVTAKLLVAVPPKSKGSKPVAGTSVTASPGGIVNVRVQPVPGTPAHATLRIAIPHTSGNSITVEAGGTGGQPSSTATINSSSGTMRISGLGWRCALPPATFCPFSSIKTTFSGLEIAVPAPQIPVTLALLTDKA